MRIRKLKKRLAKMMQEMSYKTLKETISSTINKQMKQANHTLKQVLESAVTMIGDVIPASIGLKNPTIILERMEQFLERNSLKLEAYVEKKLQRQYQKDTFIQKIKEQPILPPYSIRTQESLDKGLSKEDVLKRLAEIDRIIITREQKQEIEH